MVQLGSALVTLSLTMLASCLRSASSVSTAWISSARVTPGAVSKRLLAVLRQMSPRDALDQLYRLKQLAAASGED